ncbi:MAG: SLC13 family permease, partial [Thermoplasmata archaeon]
MDGMLAKALAVSILVFSYGMILSEKINRTSAALVGAVLVVAVGLVKAEDIFNEHGVVHWDALLLIFGMFVLVEVLSETGFFRYVGINALKFTKFNPVKVFVMFSALTAFLAAFMDS